MGEIVMFDANETIRKLIEDDIACVIEIDNEKHTYFVSRSEDFFGGIFKPQGTLRDLYCILFSSDELLDSGERSNYATFINEEVFKKDRYRGGVEFEAEGKKRGFFFRIICKDDKDSVILFFEESTFSNSNSLELEKIDTIQESYLFSMMVDLSNDI